MKLSICNETYPDWEHARVCADVAAAGYDGLELSLAAIAPDPSTITEDAALRLGAEARAEGLAIVGLHWLLVAPPGLHLASADAAVRTRTVEHLRHLARICAAAGGEVLVLGSPAQRSTPDGATHAEAFARVAEGCRAVAETAALCGVTLALEPLAPRLTDVMQTSAEALRMIELVDHPACRLHLDAIAMASEERPVEDIVTAAAVELVHVHVNDPTTMGGPGSGNHDQRPLLRALHGIGYDGYVSVEVFVRAPDGPRIARASAEYLRTALAELA